MRLRFVIFVGIALVIVLPAAFLSACSSASPGRAAAESPERGRVLHDTPRLEPQVSGTTALLQAISPASERVVWVSGHEGTYVRTLDGGATWRAARVPGADTLQFRDVHAAGADTAWLLSAGSGALSRIYRTTDGGTSWTLQFRNEEPEGFLDCFAFWDTRRGVAFGDAVRGRHYVLLTEDGGTHWTRVPPERLPAALPGEGSFAASGTCVTTHGASHAWVGMGNAGIARVLRTTDAGRSWTAFDTPVAAGEAAGLTSVIFRDGERGLALGGEIGKPAARGDYVARTADGGERWAVAGRPSFAGAVYGASYVPRAAAPALVVVGPGGADISRDDGRTFTRLDTLAYWSVAFASPRAGWMVGPGGRIVRVGF